MSGLVWNIRGIGNEASNRRVHFLRKFHHLNFVGILEPFIALDDVYMTRRLGFESAIANCSGKIWFLHDNKIDCNVLMDRDQFLHLKLSLHIFPSDLFVTVVYAKCNSGERRILWESLLNVKPVDEVFWLVGGDFNAISGPSKQSDGVLSWPGAVREFNNFLMVSGLLDVGFVGDRFTWTNNKI